MEDDAPATNNVGEQGGSMNTILMQTTSSCTKFSEHSTSLLERLNAQRFYGTFCDVIVRVEDCDFKLHKCILAASSSKLQILMHGLGGHSDDSSILNLKDVSFHGFRIILDYIYSGVLRLDTFCAHDVLSAATFLELHDIHRACVDFLKQVHPSDFQPRSTTLGSSTNNSFRSNMVNANSYNSYMTIDQNLPLNCNENYEVPQALGSQTNLTSDNQLGENQQMQSEQHHFGTQNKHNTSEKSVSSSHDQRRYQNQGNMNESSVNPHSMNISSEKLLGDHSKMLSSGEVLVSANTTDDTQIPMDQSVSRTKMITHQEQSNIMHASRIDINEQTFAISNDFADTMSSSLAQMQAMADSEQLLPLNLHRVSSDSVVMQSNKNMQLSDHRVLSTNQQSLQNTDSVLPPTQAYSHSSQMMMSNNQQYTSQQAILTDIGHGNQDRPQISVQTVDSTNTQIIGNPQSVESMTDNQTLNMKVNGNNLEMMPLTPQTIGPQSVQQPLTPASIQENPPTPTPRPGLLTPTPPLQQQNVFAGQNSNYADTVGNYIEDYLKLFESLQGDPSSAIHQSAMNSQSDSIEQLTTNFTCRQQMDFSKGNSSQMIQMQPMLPMDMDPNLLPLTSLPPLSTYMHAPVCSSVQSTKACHTNPQQLQTKTSVSVSNANNVGATAEDVRKTILSVLSQERFDDEDDLLSRSVEGIRVRENIPLTSLLNIATVGVPRSDQSSTIMANFNDYKEPLGFKNDHLNLSASSSNNNNFDISISNFPASDHIDSDSDKEGNLVIAESDFEEHVQENYTDIVNKSALNCYSRNDHHTSNMMDGGYISQQVNSDVQRVASLSDCQSIVPFNETYPPMNESNNMYDNSNIQGKFTLITEYEDANRTNGGNVSQQDKAENFAKPLKKRLRLKLKLKRTEENENGELNTPNENDISVVESVVEGEPISRKKHLLEGNKLEANIPINVPANTNSNDDENDSVGIQTIVIQPENIGSVNDVVSHTPSPIEGIPKLDIAFADSVDESFFLVQSKKQKASKQQSINLASMELSMKTGTKEADNIQSVVTENVQSNTPDNTAETDSDTNHKKQKAKQPKKITKKKQAMVRLHAEANNLQTSDKTAHQDNSSLLATTPSNVNNQNSKFKCLQNNKENPMPMNDVTAAVIVVNVEQSGSNSHKHRSMADAGKQQCSTKTKRKSNRRDITSTSLKEAQLIKVSGEKSVNFKEKKKKHSAIHSCDKCGRNFPKLERLQHHLKQHRLNLLHACHICGQKFGRSGELTRHLRNHSQDVYTCKTCSAEFTNVSLYKAHCLKVHKQERIFYCKHPGCTFDSTKLSKVEIHAFIHSDQKCFTCENCGQTFRQPNGLRGHIKSCKKELPYKCEKCDKKFNYIESLRLHIRTHTDEKPLECAICHVRVRDRRNLKRHMRIHDKSYPYICPHCPKKYRYSNSLKAHLTSQHSEPSVSLDVKIAPNNDRNKGTNTSSVNTRSDNEVSNVPQTVLEKEINSPDSGEISPPPRPTGPPKLWDATAITVKSSDLNVPLKVTLEANLVKDSGYL